MIVRPESCSFFQASPVKLLYKYVVRAPDAKDLTGTSHMVILEVEDGMEVMFMKRGNERDLPVPIIEGVYHICG